MEFAARETIDAAKHRIGVDHWRDRLRRHEGSDLDGVQPGTDELLDKGDPVRHADGRLFVLQAVARPHFDDAHGIADAALTRPKSLGSNGLDLGELAAFADD